MLTKNLNTHTVYQHIVLHMLNEEQNTILMRLEGGAITAADKEPSLHCIIVTGDDKWCYFVRLNPRPHGQLGNHHDLHASRNSVTITLKGRSCYRCSLISRGHCASEIYLGMTHCKQKTLHSHRATFARLDYKEETINIC
ncbi:uncharacterized protein TNCV_597871 [Trichonephila clavipes]|nr:uncharacterized protein TNCV_597871 [Trichonephila clavipes]